MVLDTFMAAICSRWPSMTEYSSLLDLTVLVHYEQQRNTETNVWFTDEN